MDARFLSRGAFLTFLAVTACGGEEPMAPGQTVTSSGAVEVIITTIGSDFDPDGYTLRVGADTELRVAVNDTVQIADLPVSEIRVSLVAVSTNCGVGPSKQQVINVESGSVSRLRFTVTCQPSTSLKLIVSAVGSQLRPLTYVGQLEDIENGGVPNVRRFSDSVTIGGVGAGTKAVTLQGLSNNCQVQGQNPRTVEILRDVPAKVTFVVQCQGPLRDQILFAGRRPGGAVRVWAVNTSDGDGLIPVGPGGHPAVSPDGSTLATGGALYGAVNTIYLTDLNTGLVRAIQTPGLSNHPDWSPAGQRIVFMMDEDIHVMNVDGSGLVNLTNHPALDRVPVWSPDGSKIAFQSYRDGGPPDNGEIYVMNADGSQLVNLTNNLVWDGDPSWSPDGSRIAFASDRDPTMPRGIYVMGANGSTPVRLSSSGNAEHEPSWSPDGSRIVYVAGSTGIRTVGPDGSSERDAGPVDVFDIGPWQPAWSGP